MKDLKEYTIPFVGLKVGNHLFEYKVGKEFFEHFEFDEFNETNLAVELNLLKKTTMMELSFTINGTININCDVTNEPFDQYIEAEHHVVVKFGDAYNDEHEEILILPHGEYELHVAQYVYETSVLAVPSKRVHPGIEDGTLNSDVLDKLEELSIKENNDPAGEETDPRWDTLKKLLNDK
ncbi:DUF177 domain-containing protein [Gangjinia marincola]|uniref:DUF177 domain-containing protein n=1 Tax=Gangjinia marincola TaxID=578463 RepID=A0ABP3XWC0_9FLAO